jgi:RNA polymerase sigma-70 factor (ECF subfamily)
MIAEIQNQQVMLDEDARLVDELKQRSNDAWAYLYDTHFPSLYRYVFARSSDARLSEDLAADVFLEALKGIDRFEHRGKPIIAWLYRIAHNLVADHFAGRRPVRPMSEVAGGDSTSAGQLIGAGIPKVTDPALAVSAIDVREAMTHVKDEHREVIALHYYAGLTIPEIAFMWGKKERAVYSLHERALESLRRKMHPEKRIPSSTAASRG